MNIQTILTSNVVNLSSLKEFFADDKDSITQLITVYISDTEPRTKTLEKSLIHVHYDEIKSICHFLKSSAGLMGIKCVDEIVALEKLAENRVSEEIIKENLNFITPILNESIVEYKMILAKLKDL